MITLSQAGERSAIRDLFPEPYRRQKGWERIRNDNEPDNSMDGFQEIPTEEMEQLGLSGRMVEAKIKARCRFGCRAGCRSGCRAKISKAFDIAALFPL